MVNKLETKKERKKERFIITKQKKRFREEYPRVLLSLLQSILLANFNIQILKYLPAKIRTMKVFKEIIELNNQIGEYIYVELYEGPPGLKKTIVLLSFFLLFLPLLYGFGVRSPIAWITGK